uniref:Uncharacterized protein n=1 Tax=Tanacetum cinerariifolium TaxID=118510 RepID=A0A699JK69_TANCI|nr:hypothetical protein [Tanacetum cinerariifolium]
MISRAKQSCLALNSQLFYGGVGKTCDVRGSSCGGGGVVGGGDGGVGSASSARTSLSTTSSATTLSTSAAACYDKDVILEEVEVKKNANVQGRPKESQAKVYHIDLKLADKVLSMQDDVKEPAEFQEVTEVVTTAKLMTKVVTAATTTITAAALITASTIIVALTAARRRKWVVIKDPEETTALSIIIHTKPKSKDKGKGIMVQEHKPLKKKAQIEQDEAYTRELEAEQQEY